MNSFALAYFGGKAGAALLDIIETRAAHGTRQEVSLADVEAGGLHAHQHSVPLRRATLERRDLKSVGIA